jgi:hypothetical protein
MAAKILPASAGWQWAASSIELVSHHPAPLFLSTFLVLLCTSALIWLPVLGALAIGIDRDARSLLLILGMLVNLLLGSIMIVGLSAIYRGAEKGEKASLNLFLRPVKEKLVPLLILSAVFVAAIVVALITYPLIAYSVFSVIDVTALFDNSKASGQIHGFEGIGKMLLVQLVFGLFLVALMIPVLMAYWFSPFLIAWDGMPVGKALRISFTACLGNWKAFLVNGAVCLLAALTGFTAALILSELPVNMGFLPAFAMNILIMPFMFANYYFSYKTIFPEQETPEK